MDLGQENWADCRRRFRVCALHSAWREELIRKSGSHTSASFHVDVHDSATPGKLSMRERKGWSTSNLPEEQTRRLASKIYRAREGFKNAAATLECGVANLI